MRKKENFIDIQVNMKKKNRDTGWIGRYGGFLLAYFYLFLAVNCFFMIYSSVFEITYQRGVFLSGTLLICLICLLIYSISPAKIRVSVMLAVFAGWGLAGFLVWEKLQPGAFSALDSVIYRMNEFYNTSWVIDGEKTGTIGQNTGFLLYMMVPLGLILGAGIVRKFRPLVLAFVFLFPIGGAMLVGQMPPIFPILLLIFSMLAAFSGKRARIAGFMGKQAAFGMVCMALPVALVSGILLIPVNRFYENNNYFASIKEYFNQEIWPYFEALGASLPFGGSGSAVNGNLNSGELVYEGTKELCVTIDYQPDSALYLKGYVGDHYTGEKWAAVDGDELLDYAEGKDWAYEQDLGQMAADMTYDILEAGSDMTHADSERDMTYADSENMTHADSAENLSLDILSSGEELTYRKQHMTLERVHASRKYAYLPYFSKTSEKHEADGDGAVQGLSSDMSEIDYYVIEDADIFAFDLDDHYTSVPYVNFLKEYKTYVYDNYLDYPAEGLSRLEQQCLDNPQENVWQIRDYIVSTLKNATSYDIHTEAFPDGEDFVEYFLYTQKTGYCVHYASAAALMFRMYGVPARFVTGYIAPANTFFDNGDGTYTAELMDDMTHAWVEIYTDLGWVPVEVTPPYEGSNWAGHMESDGENSEAGEPTDAEEIADAPDNSEILTETPAETQAESEVPTETETAPESGTVTGTETPPASGGSEGSETSPESGVVTDNETASESETAIESDTSTGVEDGDTKQENSLFGNLLVLSMSVVVLLLLAMAVNALVRQISRRTRFHGPDYNSNIRYIYQYLYKALQFDHFSKDIRISDKKFAYYLVKQYPRILPDEAELFVKQVLRANYSSDRMTQVECMQARSFYRKVCREISGRNSLLRRVQFRMIKGF